MAGTEQSSDSRLMAALLAGHELTAEQQARLAEVRAWMAANRW